MSSSEEHHRIGSERQPYRITPPSSDLKERALTAGRNAWAATASTDIPWGSPVLRLVACLAIAVGLVHFGNAASKHSTERWIASEPSLRSVADLKNSSSEGMVLPFVAIARGLSPEDAPQDILSRQRRIQELLETAGNQNG